MIDRYIELSQIFTFVHTPLLQFMALTFAITIASDAARRRIKWLYYLISVGYMTLFLIYPNLDHTTISIDLLATISLMPFYMIMFVPKFGKFVPKGKYFFSIPALTLFYIMINALWIWIEPSAGNILSVLFYGTILLMLYEIICFGGKEHEKN